MQIVFDKKLYDLKAIKTAVAAFSDLAEFSLKSNSRETVVEIKNSDQEIKDIIGSEFANFVLAQMKK